MKKIAFWIVVNIIWPVLRDVIVETLKLIIKFIFDKILQFTVKWEERTAEQAETKAEETIIRENYRDMRKELENLRGDISSNISAIVEDALREVESKRDRLLEHTEEKIKLLEVKTESPVETAKKRKKTFSSKKILRKKSPSTI